MAAKAKLDNEIAGRVRAVQAEQVLATELTKRAEFLKQLSACMELREELLGRKEAGAVDEADEDGDADGPLPLLIFTRTGSVAVCVGGGHVMAHEFVYVNGAAGDNERDIEALEMRLSITDQNIEEAMAELGLSGGDTADPSSTAKPEPRGVYCVCVCWHDVASTRSILFAVVTAFVSVLGSQLEVYRVWMVPSRSWSATKRKRCCGCLCWSKRSCCPAKPC